MPSELNSALLPEVAAQTSAPSATRLDVLGLGCGLAVTIASFLGLLWLANAPPFSLPREIVGTSKQTERAVEVVITNSCPFAVELFGHLNVYDDGGGAVEIHLEGWREKSGCKDLKLQVSLPLGAAPQTEWMKRAKNEQAIIERRGRWEPPPVPKPADNLNWVSEVRGPQVQWTALLGDGEIADAFSGSKLKVRLLLPELGIKSGFSSRALRFLATVVPADASPPDRPLSTARATLIFPDELEVIQVMPEPDQRETFPGYFVLYRRPAAEGVAQLDVGYRTITTKKMEDFLVVIFTSLIGIGAAAAYQAGLNLYSRRHTSNSALLAKRGEPL